MQVLREHYTNLLIALNGIDNIRTIEPIAHYNPAISNHSTTTAENFYREADSLMLFDCKIDTEGKTQYYFCKAKDESVYYISCTIDEEKKVIDKVIFKLTTDAEDAMRLN